jgi:hypothetical protein
MTIALARPLKGSRTCAVDALGSLNCKGEGVCSLAHDLARAAVKYAVDGYPVLPVKPGSNAPPLEQGWQCKASDDGNGAGGLSRVPTCQLSGRPGPRLVIVDCDSTRAISQARALGAPLSRLLRAPALPKV